MHEALSLSLRNLKRYYRNKGAFFFSFLSVFIVVALYIFFLSDVQIESLKSQLGNVRDIDAFIYTWIVGGLLCIPAVSVPLIILTFKVEDLVVGIQDDIMVTPVRRSYILLGYIFPAWAAGVIMTLLTFVLGEVFIIAKSGPLISLPDFLLLAGIVSLLVLSFSGLSFFTVLFIKTNASLTAFYTILNTLVGFLAGLYIPLGSLSGGIAVFIKVIPLSHAAAMLRQILMKPAIKQVFKNAPDQMADNIRLTFGVDISLGGHVLGWAEMLISLIVFGLLFYSVSIIILKNYKRK